MSASRAERLELHLSYHCSERCVFCSEAGRMREFRRYPVTWGRAARVVREHAASGGRELHLTGGEPTLHRRFIDLLALAKKLRLRTSAGSIGSMLAREDFASRALPLLDELMLSLHGPDAATHDALVRRRGSFDRVLRATRLVRELGPHTRLLVDTVVVRGNADRLPDTAALADSLGAELVVVSNPSPEGAAGEAYEELALPLEELGELLPRVPPRVRNAAVRFFGVPMCLLGPYAALSNDLHWDPRVTVEWTREPGRVRFARILSRGPGRRRAHVRVCSGCAARGTCAGVFDRVAEGWSTAALRPVSGAA